MIENRIRGEAVLQQKIKHWEHREARMANPLNDCVESIVPTLVEADTEL